MCSVLFSALVCSRVHSETAKGGGPPAARVIRLPAASLTLLLFAAALAGCAQNNDAADTDAPTPAPSATPTGATPSGGTCTSTLDATKSAKEPVLLFQTSQGDIRLTLFCDKAPVTAQHIVKLAEAGCYDRTKFHRVVRGFMNQGGDPLSKDDSQSASWGTGGPGDCGQSPETITEEFYCKDGTISTATPSGTQQPTQCDANGGLGLRHTGVGVLSMARTSAPRSSGSQFFLTAADASFLDGRYTIFGHTADEASNAVVTKINNLPCGGRPCADPPQGSSRTDTPVVIERATVSWS